MISMSILFLVLLALLIEGFFSGSELALLSADRIQLRKLSKQGNAGAALALRMLQSPDRILSSTLIVTSTCVMTITVLLTLQFRQIDPEHGEYYAVILGSLLVIIFGELIPKFLCRKHSAIIAPKVSRPIFIVQKILSPLIHLTSLYTSQLSKIIIPLEKIWLGKKNSAKEDLHVILAADSADTQIKTSEQKLIRKILKFRDKIAKDGMIPLVQVDAIDRGFTLGEAYEVYHLTKHSRLPVYEDRIDNIVGVLELNTIIRLGDQNQKIERYIRPVFYVPESQRLENVMNEMMDKAIQFAVVVDEYGGAVGVLTREDVFEQIVGDLEDEDDLEHRSIRSIRSNVWLVQSSVPIIKLNEELQLDIPEGDYDTLSGFLLRQFSRIPETGDELYFDTRAGQIHFMIREATSRRIESVSIERIRSSL
jgi:putative hemolysin